MKKWISWLLIFSLIFCFTGCEKEEMEDVINAAIPVLIAVLDESGASAEERERRTGEW